jgi:peptidoglycan/LPS O-acetylase OafA/YrhL
VRGGRFATLDGLRGIAALAVMALHVCDWTTDHVPVGAGSAVDFFFLLSGFVLAYAYPRPGLDFLRTRWIRLYPLCLLGTVLGAVGALLSGFGAEWQALPVNLLGLPAPLSHYPFDLPLWSIAFEAVASALYFLAARWLSVPVLMVAATGLALVTAAGPAPNWGFPALVRTLLPFAVGIALQKLPTPRLGERWGVYSAAILAILLATPFLLGHPVIKVLVFAGILTAGRAEPPPELRAAALYLGRLSFPLYAVHMPVVWWVSRHGPHGVLGALIASAASIVTAHLAMTLYDEPARRFLTRVTSPARMAYQA